MQSANRKVFLRYIISFGLLTYLLYLLDLKQIVEVLASSEPVLIGMVIIIFGMERTLGAYRWHMLLGCIHVKIPWRIVFKATFISGFLGNFLPGIVGTEIARVFTITRSTNNLASAISTVIFDRALGALALISIALTAIAIAPHLVPESISVLSGLMLLIFVAGMLSITSSQIRPTILRSIRNSTPDIILHKVERLLSAVELIAIRKKILLLSVLLALVCQMLRILTVIVGAYALGYEIALIYFVIYVPIILALMLLPISLAGLGIREAGFVYFFGAELMPAESAFTLSLVIYLGSVIAQLPGLIFWLQGIEKLQARKS